MQGRLRSMSGFVSSAIEESTRRSCRGLHLFTLVHQGSCLWSGVEKVLIRL